MIPAYSPSQALFISTLCRMVKDPALATSEDKTVIDHEGDRCVVFRDMGRLFVIFRSSDNRDNWISNLRAVHVDGAEQFNQGKIHKGFARAVTGMLQRVWDAVRDFTPDLTKPLPLYFGGHSRGGPLAMATAFLLPAANVMGLHTYGAPRWCDKVLAREYDFRLGARTFKHINNNDVVPGLPPWRLGWQHVGRAVYIDRKGKVTADVHTLPFWDRFMGAVEDIGRPGLDALRDHSGDNLESYILPLENACGHRGNDWQVEA